MSDDQNFHEKKIEKLNLQVEQLEDEKELMKLKLTMRFILILAAILVVSILMWALNRKNATVPDTIYIDDETFLGHPNHAYKFEKDDKLEMSNPVHRNMIQSQLTQYVEAFYNHMENNIEDEATKKVYMMSDKNAWEQYKTIYKKFIDGNSYLYIKDKYWAIAKVKDFNFIDDNTAQIRIAAVLLLKKPTKEYDRIELRKTNLVQVKFKVDNLFRTEKEREYNPIDLIVTDLKELD